MRIQCGWVFFGGGGFVWRWGFCGFFVWVFWGFFVTCFFCVVFNIHLLRCVFFMYMCHKSEFKVFSAFCCFISKVKT